MKFKRIHVIVMDSVGIGEAPDASDFGDVGANTLGNIARTVGLKMPNLRAMGLANIAPIEGMEPNRHDYALSPFEDTTLNYVQNGGYDVISVGKIEDIFNGSGITKGNRTANNMDGVDKLLRVLNEDFNGLSFTNLVDFDSVYGHRRNVAGYGQALEEFDARIPEILEKLHEDDLLIITADHGNDPTFTGTDHTREYVPILVYSPSIKQPKGLEAKHFSDIGATISDNFKVESTSNGQSFLNQLI